MTIKNNYRLEIFYLLFFHKNGRIIQTSLSKYELGKKIHFQAAKAASFVCGGGHAKSLKLRSAVGRKSVIKIVGTLNFKPEF